MHLVVKKNMTGRDDLAGALAPVREALLDSARAEAARIRAAADAAAEATVAAARDEADQIRAQARERGAADAATALGADRSRVRRQARAVLLAARREGSETLRAAARATVLDVRSDPGYPRLHAALIAAARRSLGPGTRTEPAEDGGVIGTRGARRIDLSLTALADRAVEDCAGGLDQP